METNNILILAGKNIKDFNQEVIDDPKKIVHLDASNNLLKQGNIFEPFKNLKTLIIDNNYFSTIEDFPKILSLETLSANKNNFNNLNIFLNQVKQKFPNLIHLSLLVNPMNDYFKSDDLYMRYKKQIQSALPKLKFLDGLPISYNIEQNKPNSNSKDQKNDQKQQQQQQQQQKKGGQVQVDQEQGIKIEYNEKYINRNPSQNIQSKSEGNRFLKNNQL